MRASSRPLVVIALVAAVVAACAGGGSPAWTAPPGASGTSATEAPGPTPLAQSDPGTSAAPASGAPASACDTSNLPDWPKPGQITTTGQVPVIASSQLAVGRSRFLFTVIDDQNRPIAAPDLRADLAIYDLCADPATPTQTLTAPFTWGIEGLRGYYVAYPSFIHAGTWGTAIVFTGPGGSQGGGKLQRRISSDTNPNPDFYRASVDAALAAGEPFVLVFATPSFCVSSQCGPTLQLIKDVAATGPKITVINVEPYQVQFDGTRLRPVLDTNGNIQPVAAAEAYGLPTEPWVFVVDRGGRVVASFEAVVSRSELTTAIGTALDRLRGSRATGPWRSRPRGPRWPPTRSRGPRPTSTG